MAFEQETRQEHIEKLEQLQKQKENERIQQELDLAIARIENEQVQRILDDAIESLDQQISHQDENIEEQVIVDQKSRQSSSSEEELSTNKSVREEERESLNILENSSQCSEDQLFLQLEKYKEEQQAQNQELIEIGKSLQEEKDFVRNQEIDLNLRQLGEENKQFQQDQEQLNLLEQLTQSSDEQSFFYQEEYTEEQRTKNQDLKKVENSLQEKFRDKTETGVDIEEKIKQNVNKQIIREQNGIKYDKEIEEKEVHKIDQPKEKRNNKDLKQEIEVKTKRKGQLAEEAIEEKQFVKEQRKNKQNGSNKDIQQDTLFQKKITPTISHTHITKPSLKHLSYSNASSDLLQEFRRTLKSNYQGDISHINQLITKVNTQLDGGEDLNSGVYDILAKLGTNKRYPNLVMVYRKDGQKSLELLDTELYDKLLEYQKQGNFRLEWQRFWFEGLGKIKPSYNFRKVFLVDLIGDRTLPPDMRRIWAVKNSYTWNIQTPTKRELHSKSIKDFFGTLFGKRPKYSDFRDVKNFTYQKKMNYVWKKFQEIFSSEIILQTTKRPTIFPLKRDQAREKIEHALIGTFWHYYNSLDRIGKRNLKSWGYNNLLKFMERKAEGVYRTNVDPNYVGQKFIVRVTNKGGAFSKFLESLKELRKSGKLESKYAINKIYREWILKNELKISKNLNGFTWTVDKARQSRTIMFKDIRDLMNENNTYGVGAVLEALFENEIFIKRLNKITGRRFSTKLACSPSGSARINTDATSIAYPDLTITQPDGKPINVQIKDLGKCYNKEKEEWVLIDQLKSLFGASDDYENITIHVINALDILDVIDPKIHPNLVTHNGLNFGLINIGIWENIEGIKKFGEIFSALRTLHEAGYSGKDAIEKALNCLGKIHPVVDVKDVSLVEKLEGLWSENLAELIINISENFGDYFRDKTVRKEKNREKQDKEIPQEQLPVTPIQTQSLFWTQKEFRGTIKGGVLIGRLEKRLEHQPVFRRYWLECTGQIEAARDTSEQGPRGLIVDLTKDSFLPSRHRKVYLVKNNLRWNALGYRDKELSLGSFNEFTKLLFNKIVIKRDFNNNRKYSWYIWEKIQKEWNFVEKPEFQLLSHTQRPQTYVLKEEYIKNRFSIQKKILQIHSSSENINNKLFKQDELSTVLKSRNQVDISSVKRFTNKLTNKIQSGVKLNEKDFEILKKLNADEEYPNIAFIRAKDGKISFELLESKLYDQLKKGLTILKNNLVFQRFWFECMGKIEVIDKDSMCTPRGLIVDLTKDSFLPKRHRQMYLVKNSKIWNELGHKKYKLSDGSFDDFLRFFFNKKTIRNFSQNIQYPRYIWEQIQTKWRIAERDGFKLKPHGYRPNIYALKKEFTKSIVEKTMVGVYQEYKSLLNRKQKEKLRKSEFSNLVRFLNQTNDLPKVFRPSLMFKKKFDSLI